MVKNGSRRPRPARALSSALGVRITSRSWYSSPVSGSTASCRGARSSTKPRGLGFCATWYVGRSPHDVPSSTSGSARQSRDVDGSRPGEPRSRRPARLTGRATLAAGEPEPARPVGGRHLPLADRLHVAEPDGAGRRCRRAPRPCRPAARRAAASSSVGRHRAELDPLAGVRRPGAGRRRAGADLAVDRDGRLGPVDAGVVDGDLGGERLTPSAGCGRASRRAVVDAVERGDQQPGAALGEPGRAGRRRCRRARIVSVITPYVGPASSSLTIRNVVAPVTSSPAQIACCTGAAPRQAGRQREVQVDPAVRRDVERRLRQQRAVGDHRAAVGRQRRAARPGTPGRAGGRA